MLGCRVEPSKNQSISALLSNNRGAKARLGAFLSHHIRSSLKPTAGQIRSQKQCLDLVHVLLANSTIPTSSANLLQDVQRSP